jgi:hypothetical protein
MREYVTLTLNQSRHLVALGTFKRCASFVVLEGVVDTGVAEKQLNCEKISILVSLSLLSFLGDGLTHDKRA